MENWRTWVKKYQLFLLAGFILLQTIGIGLLLLNREPAEEEAPLSDWVIEEEESSTAAPILESTVEPVEWMVDIKGEVRNPGVYPVEQNMRVYDVIELAGGLKDEANTATLNFAQQLSDQMMIYVPHKDEEVVPVQSQLPSENVAETDLINLNEADVTALLTLPGIGEKKAQLILQYRTDNGSFANIEELMEVKGIGQKTFDALKEQITVSK
ncbi:helix-hairpin-helix domain-containing protein [Jeotgalibaca caeni]|uniref:helix-hairpin-helix domain-containing protein n=1 Tax=Jeotgalibaca caeni TaxID=3028623 RepID=UPI00237E365D|nr:helix-hairpin-helix domain-containing protein [Jeotgalibaca caeni]MDE1549591.1 helix-hairpin-helix domain-containing protein [Jeotgalibaca caeni]